MSKHNIGGLLSQTYPLLAILIGVALISITIGPYRSRDTQLEFRVAQGVLKWGYPYLEIKGNFFDMPPLGFYAEALFFLLFGSTMENGIALIMLFGLASIVAVYKLGKEAYGKSTGLFAAAFFALAPWQLVLSRAFLIDAQCLFLSLVYLYFGILAIRKDSVKLALVSGIFFAASFLTKQYAVFMLIPLLLLYAYRRPKNPKQILLQLGAFILPAICSTLLWYQIIMGRGLLYLVQHDDFRYLNSPEVIPSYSFITTFLIDYGLGAFFVAAVVFSLMIGLLFWKRFSKQSVLFDIVCLVTILSILGLNMYLGVTLNLKVPYTSAIKYSYQSLPFFSLAAASLASKSASLLKSSKNKSGKLKNVLLFSVGLVGLFLLVTPILDNMNTAHQLTRLPYLIFRVQPDQDVGYSFVVLFQTSQNNILPAAQFLGFMIILSGLLWASRAFISDI
ncbi:glycosyltransferase family 39 protein [Candidatus Bathyarchaeota archaeon A05DMB-2]|nr:glycosyltransferase family 39 protein [Candidatus Bathyarchaeota archaeon A05DMB-2]